MTPGSVLGVVLHVLDLLEELSIDHHLGGSFASTIHGIPRQTADADLVLDLRPPQLEAMISALSADFYVSEEAARRALRGGGSFNAVHFDSGFKVDFFVAGDDPFDRVELDRSVAVQVTTDPPRTAAVKSAEDTILRKLQWYRDGGGVSDRQLSDVRGILRTRSGSLDLEHLRTWAPRLGVADLLERLLDEV